MKTLYGELPNEMIIVYVKGLTNKVFKMLPLKEENSPTLPKYNKALLRELIGFKELIIEMKNNQNFMTLLDILQILISENDLKNYRSDILRALSIIKRIESSLGVVDDELS